MRTFGIIPINFIAAILCGISLFLNLSQTADEEYVYKITQEYKELTKQVETFNELQDPGIINIFKDDIEKKVYDMNELILKNRYHYNSKWDGYKYSEEIGNLKILEL